MVFSLLELAVPNFMKDVDLKKIIQQISYNVLNILTTEHEKWEAAGLILNKFATDLDNFVKARVSYFLFKFITNVASDLLSSRNLRSNLPERWPLGIYIFAKYSQRMTILIVH